MANQPSAKFRIGAVTATVWENGEDKKFFSVNLSRSYKDSDGEWKQADNLNHGDLLNAAKALKRAENWIAVQ